MSDYSSEIWRCGLLGEILFVQNGYAFKSQTFTGKSIGAVPIIRMSNLKSGICDLADAVYVDKEKVIPPHQFVLEEGDFVFGMSGSLSNYATIRKQNLPCYLNQRVGKLCPKDSHKSFLNHLFLSETVQRQILATAAGGAQLNISARQIEDIEVYIPPLKEQKKIAEILTSVDEVIENTQSQINKLEDLKRATMNELMTKGIGHTEFKETEIGRIPKDWNVESLKTLATVRVSNVDKKSYDGEVHVRLCNYMDVYTNRYLTDDQKYMLSTASERETTQFGLKQGDLLITKDSESPDDIGIPALIDSQVKTLVCGYHLALISPTTKVVDSKYLLWWLQSNFAKKWFYVNANGTTRYGLPTGSIESLPVPIPSVAEQNRIAHIGRHFISELNFYNERKNQQVALKNSLMQDLLAGKVRVTVN
jgi:type I restriction enzyme S subunit